eukprot:3761672-Pyramimonas_sp.AAC.1
MCIRDSILGDPSLACTDRTLCGWGADEAANFLMEETHLMELQFEEYDGEFEKAMAKLKE